MTWAEIERKSTPKMTGAEKADLWDCVYLRKEEVGQLLAYAWEHGTQPWVYPLLCTAAHTGARRSELLRIEVTDVNFDDDTILIREKKRSRKQRTTRRVSLTPFLKEVLAAWMRERGKGGTLFCKGDGKAITPREAHNYFQRGLRLSKWGVLKGWHVFRHSFISALASRGVDQRVIDDLVGHSTEEQRRRYRHLYPDVKQQAVQAIFE